MTRRDALVPAAARTLYPRLRMGLGHSGDCDPDPL